MDLKVPAAKINIPKEDRDALLNRIDGILETGQLTLGKYTKEFEDRYAAYVGTRYAVAVSSGTAALEITLRALDISGSSVIVPTNTFFATAASVIHAGAKVIFADASDNLCLDPQSVERSIEPDTKAVIIVHIGGLVPPQLAEIRELCQARGLLLIEDAAHAHGSTWNGAKAGSFGTAGAFSFYPTKVITSGEGGMITTSDETIYERALVFRDQGKAGFSSNLHTEMGYNWRMSEIHAAIGLSQFARLEQFIADRTKIAHIYNQRLAEVDDVTPITIPAETTPNYYKYSAMLPDGIDRTRLKSRLRQDFKVSLSGEVYELPCHLQPVLQRHPSVKAGDLKRSELLCSKHICLPVFAGMSDAQAHYVVDSLKEVLH